MPCELTDLEQRVLNRIQQDFPLDPAPYQVVADTLGCGVEDAHAAVRALCERGVIRRIGASFIAARLGYESVLVAARVAEDAVEHAAHTAGSFPEVTHNYQREGAYNLWFTIIAAQRERFDEILAAMRACAGVQALAQLPARRIFKLRVDFRFPAPGAQASPRALPTAGEDACAPSESPRLTDLDRRLIARVCGDLGVARHPYRALAAEFGLTEAAVLRRLQAFRDAGLLRRVGAVLRHQLAGFTANGLCVWNVPDGEVGRVGEQLAASPAVSHCYERPRLADWPYNLYAMLHAPTRASCTATAAQLAAAVGMHAYLILYSVREFKKTSLEYFHA